MVEEIKLIVARNILLANPDFNKQFEIHINTSDFQLGVVIIQGKKPQMLYKRENQL